MSRGATALVLGARDDQLPVFAAARRRAMSVATIDPDPAAPGLAEADASLVADLADDERCLAFASIVEPACVVTFAADYPVPLAGRLAAALGLNGLSAPTTTAATDKLAMRDALAGAGVAVPRWRHVICGEDGPDPADVTSSARAVATNESSMVVVKPRQSSGSRGVAAIVASATEALDQAVRSASEFDTTDGVLIEEMVDGPEVSVEAAAVDGRTTIIARTGKLTTGAPQFVEIGHQQPALLSPEEIDRVDQSVRAAMAAIGLHHGIGHVELRLTPAGPVVIEIAARAAGGAIAADLTPLTTGVDVADLTLALALGERPTVEPSSIGAAAVRFIQPTVGTVARIDGEERAVAMPGVQRVDLWVEPGARIADLVDARQRVGRVIATGADAQEASARAEAASAAIELVVTDRRPTVTRPQVTA